MCDYSYRSNSQITNDYAGVDQTSPDGYYKMVRQMFEERFTGEFGIGHTQEMGNALDNIFNLTESDYLLYSKGQYNECFYESRKNIMVRTGVVAIFLPSSKIVRMDSMHDFETYGIQRVLDDPPIQTFFHHREKLLPGALVYITKLRIDIKKSIGF